MQVVILLQVIILNSNTTLVKVKSYTIKVKEFFFFYSNTTLVKVKSKYADKKSILVRLFKYNTC